MIRNIEVFGIEVPIEQNISSNELGATVWDSALILTKYLENNEEFPYPDYWKNKNVIELGSGTGVVGITLAVIASGVSGFHITITDRETLTPLIQQNCRLNKISDSRATVQTLDWSQDIDESILQKSPYDVILLSDVVANAYSPTFKSLVETLEKLSGMETRILLAYELRDKEDLLFFELLKEHNFDYEKVPFGKLDPNYNAEDIGIFEIKKKA